MAVAKVSRIFVLFYSFMVKILSFIIGLSFVFSLAGQTSNDTVYAEAGLGYLGSNEEFVPFLLEHNRWGIVNPEQQSFIQGNVFYGRRFSKDWTVSAGTTFRNDQMNEYFVSGAYDFVDLTIGAKRTIIGGIQSDLMMVNYGLGRNAAPAPMIELNMNRYLDVPFTQGIVKFKARIGHRWLEENRYQSKALMHNKDLYVLFDFKKSIGWQISTGLVHIAQYGGTSPWGLEQPKDFSTYMDVFFGRGAGEGSGTAGENNGRGNHLGMHEIMFKKYIGEHELTLDYQSPFEDGGSMQYVSFQNFLLALNWKPSKKIAWLSEVQIEYTQTLRQSGPGLPDATPNFPDEDANFGNEFGGRDDYHNNWLYRNGYTYRGLIMGNPLFLTHDWTMNFLDPYKSYDVTVSSNRIQAWVASVQGSISEKFNYRVQYVRSRHFGSYKGLYDGRFNWGGIQQDPNYDYPFWPSKTQHSSLVSLSYVEPLGFKNIRLNLLFGYDFGELYENLGAELSLTYTFLNN